MRLPDGQAHAPPLELLVPIASSSAATASAWLLSSTTLSSASVTAAGAAAGAADEAAAGAADETAAGAAAGVAEFPIAPRLHCTVPGARSSGPAIWSQCGYLSDVNKVNE